MKNTLTRKDMIEMEDTLIYESPKIEFVLFSTDDVFCDVYAVNSNARSGWSQYFSGTDSFSASDS